MGAISATDIISIIQGEIENINWDEQSRETGEVIWVGDGIVTVYGIDHAMYGEIVAFENGVKGMVQDVRQNEIGIILFGRDTGIKEGTKVVRTKKKAGIPIIAMTANAFEEDRKKAFEKGNKVKASIRFKGRQIAHPELAKEVLDRFYNEVSDVAEIELKPRIEGRTMFMQLTPKK